MLQHTRIFAAHSRCTRAGALIGAQRRTGSDGGAQQLRARAASADRIGVEKRNIVVACVEAAPRPGSPGPHERRTLGLARGGHCATARLLGLDPHGSRRALVGARGTGHVRTCARGTACPALGMSQQPRTPVPERYRGSTRRYPTSTPQLPTARQCRELPSSTRKYPQVPRRVTAEVPVQYVQYWPKSPPARRSPRRSATQFVPSATVAREYAEAPCSAPKRTVTTSGTRGVLDNKVLSEYLTVPSRNSRGSSKP
jgi:hypothetical protein